MLPEMKSIDDIIEAMRRGYDKETIAEIIGCSPADLYALRRVHMQMTGEFIATRHYHRRRQSQTSALLGLPKPKS